MTSCMCGACEACLRDQGQWGEVCAYCGLWIDYDATGAESPAHGKQWLHQACDNLLRQDQSVLEAQAELRD